MTNAITIAGVEARVHAWLDAHAKTLPWLLEKLVNIDSGSDNHKGIAAVSQEIARFLHSHGVETVGITPNIGPNLIKASVAPHGGFRGALMLGHMDTVFPENTVKSRPFSKGQGRYYGPGVADMKGGLVMNAAVVSAFAACVETVPPLSAFFTVDEEVASSISRPYIEDIARQHDLVLNSEPGRANGDIVTERKGGVFIRVDIDGVSAHSGVDFGAGASAIVELMEKARKLLCLAKIDDGITVNIGKIGGGSAINTVPDRAFLLADIRFNKASQADRILADIETLAAETTVSRTLSRFKILGRFNPMEFNEQNTALAQTYIGAAKDLGVRVNTQVTGGCSDAGFPSSLGIPTLCGVGPIGGAAHTSDEYIIAESLLVRAKIAASTVLRSAAG